MSGDLSGAMFLYGRQDEEWQYYMKVSGRNTSEFDAYSQSMDIYDEKLFVGAELAEGSTARSGAVYVETNILSYLNDAMDSKDLDQSGSNSQQDNGSTASTSTFLILVVTLAALPAVAIAALLGHRTMR